LARHLAKVIGRFSAQRNVCENISYPQSVGEISDAIKTIKLDASIKAVGGGWSFSDAALPFATHAQFDAASIQNIGAGATENLSQVIQVLSGNQTPQPIDLTPEKVAQVLSTSTHYDQTATTQVESLSGLSTFNVNWPVANPSVLEFFSPKKNVSLINIDGLASRLQGQLLSFLSSAARAELAKGVNYFHVEAGITMADLQQLLDHQHPRLALRSSGGSPGATLAGTISTATHGGKFRWPLLVDTVRAIHLVGPTGEEWWIEGEQSIADPTLLQKVYPQFGLRQKVAATTWARILAATGVENIQTSLRNNDAVANKAVLNVLLDGTLNGTGIPLSANLYADLAINPFTQDCWVTNRQVTRALPLDSNSPATSYADYLSTISDALSQRTKNNVQGSVLLGRIFDFFGWATDIPVNLDDLSNDFQEAKRLVNFVTLWPNILQAALATINVQAVANEKATSLDGQDKTNRGHLFLADVLTGFLDGIQGTGVQNKFGNLLDGKHPIWIADFAGVGHAQVMFYYSGDGTWWLGDMAGGKLNRELASNTTSGTNAISDRTDISYKVGAIGWPDGGIPGRGLEIALDPTVAFSFLQNQLFDDLLKNTMITGIKPPLGYISIRICPPTDTLFGMQQFSPYSVMIEIVGYRSPESNVLMDQIQQRVLTLNQDGLNAMLHWGLENAQISSSDLPNTPLKNPIHPGSTITKIAAFKAVRNFFTGKSAAFDNYFTRRLGL
jgi:FAD binding domain